MRRLAACKAPLGLLVPTRRLWRALAPAPLRRAAGLVTGRVVFESMVHTLARRRGLQGAGLPALVGLFSGASGVALSVQLASRALDQLGIDHRRIDVGDIAAPNDPGERSADAWIFYLNPPELMSLLFRWDGLEFAGPRFGHWAWELPEAPASWVRAVKAMDAVMAQSQYTADAFAGKPVTVTPHPLFADDLCRVAPKPRRAPGDNFTVVNLFDFKSAFARKNPLGALAAFQTAFAGDLSTRLIIKTQNADKAPELARALVAHSDRNVEIIDEIWPYARVLNLIASADALISLHRAEGFGLTLAEAMALGTPVVATGWSGNLDFMDAETACLAPVMLVPVADPQGIYRGGRWAEPNADVAAEHLRRLRDDPAFAAGLAMRARNRVLRQLNPNAWFETLPPMLRAVLSESRRRAG